MKKAIIIISCIIFLCVSFAYAEEYGEFYPRLTIVFDIEDTENYRLVHCIDMSRNTWYFYDQNFKFKQGDIVNLLMWNTNPDITQHEIIDTYLEGHIKIEHLNLFLEFHP